MLSNIPVMQRHQFQSIAGRTTKAQSFATWSVILVTSVLTFLALRDLKLYAATYGFTSSDPSKFHGLTLLTSFFVHGGWIHLISNMYFLMLFGPEVEEDLGATGFLLLLTFCTVVGNLTALVFGSELSASLPHIGASGGIFGVMLYHVLRYPKEKIGFVLFYTSPDGLPAAAWHKVPSYAFLAFMLLLQITGFLGSHFHSVGIDYSAHIGGGIAGFLSYALISAKQRMSGSKS
jgi:membrane associated rhomboid family serine protease